MLQKPYTPVLQLLSAGFGFTDTGLYPLSMEASVNWVATKNVQTQIMNLKVKQRISRQLQSTINQKKAEDLWKDCLP
jgi:hypothetical protein